MKLLLVNDTSKSKNLGCKLVMLNINFLLEKYFSDYEIDRIFLDKYKNHEKNIDKYDLIIINGDGSLGGIITVNMDRLFKECAKAKNVYLINFTFCVNKSKQRNGKIFDSIKKFNIISVREPISYEYMKEHKFESVKLFPDLGCNIINLPKIKEIEEIERDNKLILFGGGSFTKNNKYKKECFKLIFRNLIKKLIDNGYKIVVMDWASNPISDAEYYKSLKIGVELEYFTSKSPIDYYKMCKKAFLNVTGRHHGCIMSFAAECPFVTWRSNMWKTEGDCLFMEYDGWLNIDKCEKDKDLFANKVQYAIDNNEKIKNKFKTLKNKYKNHFDAHMRNVKENNKVNGLIEDKLFDEFSITEEVMKEVKKRYL